MMRWATLMPSPTIFWVPVDVAYQFDWPQIDANAQRKQLFVRLGARTCIARCTMSRMCMETNNASSDRPKLNAAPSPVSRDQALIPVKCRTTRQRAATKRSF